MKQKDIVVVIIVAAISCVIAFFVAGKIFVSDEKKQQTAEVVDVITEDFTLPDERYFNSESINPTRESELGENENQDPFSGSN